MMNDPLIKYMNSIPEFSKNKNASIAELVMAYNFYRHYFWIIVPIDARGNENKYSVYNDLFIYRHDQYDSVDDFITDLIDNRRVSDYFANYCDSYDLQYEYIDHLDIRAYGLRPIRGS